MEKWKIVPGFEQYEVSSIGNIRRAKSKKLLKLANDNGYFRVHLCMGGKVKVKFVHDLVLLAFVPNPDNLPFCDHINTIKTDNRVENLHWCTAKDNMNNPLTVEKMKIVHAKGETHQYSLKNPNRIKPHNTGKLANQSNSYYWIRCIETNKIYAGSKEIERQLGIGSSSVLRCCKGERQTGGGYHWEYASEKIRNKKLNIS